LFQFEQQIADMHRRLEPIEASLAYIKEQQGATLQAVRLLLLCAAGESIMTKLHDDLLALARQLDSTLDTIGTNAGTLIAAKGEGDSQLADVQSALASVTTKVSDLQAKLAAATAPEVPHTPEPGA
jgi:ElaB/YqjD/DUF883 family membrane-anchored ribosome-binding protein